MTDKHDTRRARPAAPTRPTRPTLDRDYIARVALSLVDDIGLDKFSMRKLGAELGVDPMAVYRYYDDQEALFDGIAESLFDDFGVTSLAWQGSWRALCEQFCERMRTTLLAHPHAVTIFATRPVRSAASIDVGNRMVALLTESGFTPAHALHLMRCLREFTVGHALSLTEVHRGRSRKPAPGTPEYNLLAQSADSTGVDEHFPVGLAAMLDGFARYIR